MAIVLDEKLGQIIFGEEDPMGKVSTSEKSCQKKFYSKWNSHWILLKISSIESSFLICPTQTSDLHLFSKNGGRFFIDAKKILTERLLKEKINSKAQRNHFQNLKESTLA